jgi:hypothetical protein
MLGCRGLLLAGGLGLSATRENSSEEMKLREVIEVSFVAESPLRLINDSVPDPSSHRRTKPDQQLRRLIAGLKFVGAR